MKKKSLGTTQHTHDNIITIVCMKGKNPVKPMLHSHPLMKLKKLKSASFSLLWFRPILSVCTVWVFFCVYLLLCTNLKISVTKEWKFCVLCVCQPQDFIVFRLSSFRKPSWAQARRRYLRQTDSPASCPPTSWTRSNSPISPSSLCWGKAALARWGIWYQVS